LWYGCRHTEVERVGEGGTGVEPAPLLSAQGMARLEDVLARRRCLLILRRHPYEAQTQPISVTGIVELTDAHLEAAGTGIYEVLAESDGLVTDVSSIWLDYLVVDRPVIIFFPDLESYIADRRLSLDPYERWTPGPILRTEDEFLEALDIVAAGTDIHGSTREAVRRALMGDDFTDLAGRVLALAGVRRRSDGRRPESGATEGDEPSTR
jgi:CDP-glycerol glycerophosphotransferase